MDPTAQPGRNLVLTPARPAPPPCPAAPRARTHHHPCIAVRLRCIPPPRGVVFRHRRESPPRPTPPRLAPTRPAPARPNTAVADVPPPLLPRCSWTPEGRLADSHRRHRPCHSRTLRDLANLPKPCPIAHPATAAATPRALRLVTPPGRCASTTPPPHHPPLNLAQPPHPQSQPCPPSRLRLLPLTPCVVSDMGLVLSDTSAPSGAQSPDPARCTGTAAACRPNWHTHPRVQQRVRVRPPSRRPLLLPPPLPRQCHTHTAAASTPPEQLLPLSAPRLPAPELQPAAPATAPLLTARAPCPPPARSGGARPGAPQQPPPPRARRCCSSRCPHHHHHHHHARVLHRVIIRVARSA